MVTLDRYAVRSPLGGKSPAIKAAFAVGSLLLGVCVGNWLFSLGIFVLMTVACVRFAGAGWRVYLRLCAVPFVFVGIAALTVAVRFSGSPLAIGFPPEQLLQAGTLLARAMAGVSCVCFLCLSTGMSQMLALFERMHLPKLLIELLFLTYRFIFLLLGMAGEAVQAQRARLGGGNFRARLRSLAMLCGSLFAKAFGQSEQMLQAMEARGYDGGVGTQPIRQKASRKAWLMLVGYLVLAGLLAFASRMMEG